MQRQPPALVRPATLVLALLALGTTPAVAQDERWVGQLTPYVWASGIDGALTPFTGAPTVTMDRSFGELFEDVDASFFLSGYARRDRMVFLGDLGYSRSSKEGVVPPGIRGEGSLRQRSLTLAAGWRALEGEDLDLDLDLLVGLRNWRVQGEVEVALLGVSKSPSVTFTDALVAARANLALAPRWSLITYADVGAGGGSDKTHQWLVTLNYVPAERWAFSAGLRQLRVDYRDGGTQLDITLDGPILGASWRF